MPQFRDHPAAVFLRSIAAKSDDLVDLERVILQRAVLAEIGLARHLGALAWLAQRVSLRTRARP